jgi:D-alanyl-D-alanine carboxypeptidase/D-alanyl-D-alanine-endopeptidase (penicillin-binding protein 4)
MKKNKIVYGRESAPQKDRHFIYCLFIFAIALSSCSINNQIARKANSFLLKDTAISTGHIGISIYEPAANKYWYNYDATKYFIPASNAKLFTLYAGMKYLGDSLVGLRYAKAKNKSTPAQSWYYIQPSGDPTLLHPNFSNQPVIDFLKRDTSAYYELNYQKINFNALGKGWAWDDYNDDYMTERSTFPIYGNLYTFYQAGDTVLSIPKNLELIDHAFDMSFNFQFKTSKFKIKRFTNSNDLFVKIDSSFNNFTKIQIPFVTSIQETKKLLLDTLKNFKCIYRADINGEPTGSIIHSQPTDSLFKPMMHNSDNFFAEQTLLMASNEHLGYMNDEKIIDSILNSDLIDVPQRPKWVDGSGLSRYNLFTAQSFVYILNKMKKEFGFERMKVILPTGGEGTLSSYYKKDAGFIYAKTGTLSNNCAISGYLVTKKGKLLIFSILANNYITGATPVRKAVEQFLQQLRENY